MNQRPSLLQSLKRNGILPVFKSNDLSLWRSLIDLCHGCGLNVMEFRDGRESRGIKLFPFLVEYASRYSNFKLGISTIKSLNVCEKFLHDGAAFIYSPFLHPAIGKLCHQYDRTWIPGCSSQEEIDQAITLNSEIVSLLPGSLTKGILDSIAIQSQNLHFIPSSGNDLNDELLVNCIRNGALCIRRESKIFPAALTSVRDWRAIERLIIREIHLVRSTQAEIKPVPFSIL